MQSFAKLWHVWKELAFYIGDFQARALLTVFYFTVAVPFALVAQIFGPQRQLSRPRESNWHRRKTRDVDLAATRRQF